MSIKSKVKEFLTKKEYIKERKIFFVFITLIVLFFFFDRVFMPVVTRQVKERVVPNLVDLSLEEAEEVLKREGLSLVVMSEEYVADKPAGLVVSQTPEPESVVKKGRRIRVVVSKGAKMTVVPNLKGVSLRQAELMLDQAGLKIDEVFTTANDTFAENVVVSSVPSFGVSVPEGISVRLLINKSSSNQTVIVPNFVEKNLKEAYNIARESGLEIGKIKFKKEKSLLPNTIMEQIPKAGAEVDKGSKVELVVSKSD
jgi:eukaryotic-like serine/threonine-protein kinase